MAVLYSSNFETETNNATPVGWVAPVGYFRTYTWAERSQSPIGGLNGIFAADSGGGGVHTGIAARADQAVRFAFRVPALTTAGHQSWAGMLRSNTTFTQYYRIVLETNNTALRLSIYLYNSGSTLLASSSTYSFAPAPGDLVHLEAFAIGAAITARAWIDGTTRPATISGSGASTATYATVAATDSALASGYAGKHLVSTLGTWFGADNVVITDGAGEEDHFYPAATSTSVSSDLAAAYAIGQAISSSLAAAYGVIASINADLTASYTLMSANSISSDLAAAYAISATLNSDLAGAYQMLASVSKDLAAAYNAASAGLFVTEQFMNNTETMWAPGQSMAWTWTVGGRPGSMTGKTIVDGVTALGGDYRLHLSGLPVGAGKLDAAALGATPDQDALYAQYGTVA